MKTTPAFPAGASELSSRFAGAENAWPATAHRNPSDAVFGIAIDAFVAQGRAHFRRQLSAIEPAALPPCDLARFEQAFACYLGRVLLDSATRTLVLELNVARVSGQLDGETPERRFDSFGDRLHDSAAFESLWAEYSVLDQFLSDTVVSRVEAALELLRRLGADWSALSETVPGFAAAGALRNAGFERGDTHRDGRAVCMLRFESGLRLVYKPRPMALEAHFAELIGWLNARGQEPALRAPAVLDRGAYGWSEFVEQEACADESGIRRFYERQGANLAILYALDATDFHLENVIAAGEQPILIDLEALFHPRLPAHEGYDASPVSLLNDTALRIGLLPQHWGTRDGAALFDHSGLGAAPDQVFPLLRLQYVAEATDEMRLERLSVTVPGAKNQPMLGERPVPPDAYVDSIVSGFTECYRLLTRQRRALLGARGPLTRFANDPVRVVLRSTQYYGDMRYHSLHPNLLRDPRDRERYLSHLGTVADRFPHMGAAWRSEANALRRGDIPLFTTTPSSRHLWDCAGERLDDVLPEPSMVAVRNRIAALDDDDLARQSSIVRGSMVSLAGSAAAKALPRIRLPDDGRHINRRAVLADVRAIADRLHQLAFHRGSRRDWMGLQPAPNGKWRLAPVSSSLYDGKAGIALFLAYAGTIAGDQRASDLARSTIDDLCRPSAAAPTTGAFTGTGSVVYLLTHAGALWADDGLLEAAASLAAACRPPDSMDSPSDISADIVDGAAGMVKVLLALHRVRPRRELLDLAGMWGECVVGLAVPMERGLGWRHLSSARPLTGYAHGAAGIGAALLALAAANGNARIGEAGHAAFEYERSLFLPASGNWPDLRVESANTGMATWCHGAPGIALARAEALADATGQAREVLVGELETAFATTLREGFDGSHCLCHGALGNLDALSTSARVLGRGHVADAARVARCVVAHLRAHGPLCATPGGIETPGLMTGIAGIGYGLLRLAAPDMVPSVLTLEGPSLV